MRKFDFKLLRGQNVLAVNDAIFSLTSGELGAVTVFSLDNNWVRRHRTFLNGFSGEKYIALPLESWPDCVGIFGATYLKWDYREGLSDDPGTIHTGCNSGYAAVNLAYLKHAKTIHLVGYDMNPADGDHYVDWARRFHTMRPQLDAAGVQVWNHSPKSFIDAFPQWREV